MPSGADPTFSARGLLASGRSYAGHVSEGSGRRSRGRWLAFDLAFVHGRPAICRLQLLRLAVGRHRLLDAVLSLLGEKELVRLADLERKDVHLLGLADVLGARDLDENLHADVAVERQGRVDAHT